MCVRVHTGCTTTGYHSVRRHPMIFKKTPIVQYNYTPTFGWMPIFAFYWNTGWRFQPLWKILISQHGNLPQIGLKMKKNKPPTQNSSEWINDASSMHALVQIAQHHHVHHRRWFNPIETYYIGIKKIKYNALHYIHYIVNNLTSSKQRWQSKITIFV